MKRFILPIVLFGSALSLHAEFKFAGVTYFYPQSHILREIYGGGANYQLAYMQKVSKHFDLWAGVNYFGKDGHSLGGHHRTNIKIIPISLGLKYLFPVHFDWVDVDFYVNGALKYYFVNIHDHSSFFRKHTNENGLGGVFGVGSFLHINKRVYLNFLVDYSFKRFHGIPHKHHTRSHFLDVGGWDFGGAIGVRF